MTQGKFTKIIIFTAIILFPLQINNKINKIIKKHFNLCLINVHRGLCSLRPISKGNTSRPIKSVDTIPLKEAQSNYVGIG